jgi:16S rRNA (uracil1498-N3)-methyltransferase
VSSRIRVAIAGLAPGNVTLDRGASRHLAGVLRARRGDAFAAFDPENGVEADGLIVQVEHGRVHATLGPVRPARVVARLPITWIQGLAKGEKMDGIVRDATELGATHFVPTETAFSVVKLEGPRGEARRARWTRIAEEAARQSGRADPPTVHSVEPWDAALERATHETARFCLFERAEDPLGPALSRALGRGAPLAFAAGAEGGLADDEVDRARARGFELVSLGDVILRTETVVTAVLGAVRILLPQDANR